MRIEYHPDTVSDVNQAVDYYHQRHPGLGDSLRYEIYRAIDSIAAKDYEGGRHPGK